LWFDPDDSFVNQQLTSAYQTTASGTGADTYYAMAMGQPDITPELAQYTHDLWEDHLQNYPDVAKVVTTTNMRAATKSANALNTIWDMQQISDMRTAFVDIHPYTPGFKNQSWLHRYSEKLRAVNAQETSLFEYLNQYVFLTEQVGLATDPSIASFITEIGEYAKQVLDFKEPAQLAEYFNRENLSVRDYAGALEAYCHSIRFNGGDTYDVEQAIIRYSKIFAKSLQFVKAPHTNFWMDQLTTSAAKILVHNDVQKAISYARSSSSLTNHIIDGLQYELIRFDQTGKLAELDCEIDKISPSHSITGGYNAFLYMVYAGAAPFKVIDNEKYREAVKKNTYGYSHFLKLVRTAAPNSVEKSMAHELIETAVATYNEKGEETNIDVLRALLFVATHESDFLKYPSQMNP
jgi:hypothetical protein